MITKQQWQTDIENTKLELEAFYKIFTGFEILEQLPENQESGKSLEYRAKAYYYRGLHARCGEVLEKLEAYEGELMDMIGARELE